MPRTDSERLFVRTSTRQLIWPPPDRHHSTFREAEPDRQLAELVARVRWGHEWIPPGVVVRERIVPDGAVHLLFVLPTTAEEKPYALAVGASSEAAVVSLSGRIEHLEIELRPGAVPALLGVPAGELSGRAVALSDLWGDRAAVVQDRVRETRDPARRIGIVQEVLSELLGQGRGQPPAALGEALQRIARSGGNLRVRQLVAGLGVSDRRLEQLFHQHVGLSPKAACRLARFRHSVELLARPDRPSWAGIALDAGFYDQSHLVNEFQAMTGLAPGDFQSRAGFGFLQDRAEGGRYLPGRPGRKRA